MDNQNNPNDVIVNDEGILENARETQPLNGRKLFILSRRLIDLNIMLSKNLI